MVSFSPNFLSWTRPLLLIAYHFTSFLNRLDIFHNCSFCRYGQFQTDQTGYMKFENFGKEDHLGWLVACQSLLQLIPNKTLDICCSSPWLPGIRLFFTLPTASGLTFVSSVLFLYKWWFSGSKSSICAGAGMAEWPPNSVVMHLSGSYICHIPKHLGPLTFLVAT